MKDNLPHDDLDRLIDNALRAEPMRPVPAGLFKRIDTRLQLESVIQHQRRAVIARASFGFASVIGLSVLTAVGVYTMDVLVQAWGAIPGLLGYADYLRSFYLSGGAQGTLATVLVLATCAGGAALAGATWLRATGPGRLDL